MSASETKNLSDVDRLRDKHQYQEALFHYKFLLKEHQGYEMQKRVYIFNQMTYCYLRLGNTEEAARLIDSLLTRYENYNDLGKAQLMSNRGTLYWRTDFLLEARYSLEKADSLFSIERKKIQLDHLIGISLLANVYARNKYLIKLNEVVPRIQDAIKHNPSLLNEYTAEALGRAKNEERAYGEALSQINQALAIGYARSNLDTTFLARTHLLKARSLRKEKLSEEASEEIQKAYELTKAIKGKNQLLREIHEERLLMGINQRIDSTTFYEMLREYKTQFTVFPNPLQHPKSLLGYYENKVRNNWKRTKENYVDLLGMYESSDQNNRQFFDEAYFVLTDVYTKLHQFDSARYYRDLSFDLLFGNDDFDGLENGDLSNSDRLDVQAVFYSKEPKILLEEFGIDRKRTDKLLEAIDLYFKVDTLFYRHANVASENTLLTFAKEHFHKSYTDAIDACYEAYQINFDEKYLDAAIFFIERLKYAGFHRELVSKTGSEVPDNLLQKEQQISNRLRKLSRATFSDSKITNLAVEKEKSKLYEARKEIYKLYMQNYPDYYNQRMLKNNPGVNELSRKSNKQVLQYHFGAEDIYLLLHTRDTNIFYRQKKSNDFDDRYLAFIQALNTDHLGIEAFRTCSYQLYKDLFAPVFNHLKANLPVVIIPDASFPLLPFETLISQHSGEVSSYSELPYLLYDFDLSYSFSLKSYMNNVDSQQKIKPNPKILGFAFSDLDEAKYKKMERQLQEFVAYDKAPIASLHRANILAELEGSAIELKLIEKFFSSKGSMCYYGKNINKAHYTRQCSGDFNVILLSLHGMADEKNAYKSALFFREDTLFSDEIIKHTVQADLVVLSACETAKGIAKKGEGTYSIARSFFLANSKAVVSSLWNLNDAAAPVVTYFFFEHLKDGNAISESLNAAKRKYLKMTKASFKAHPHYWGSLVLIS
ncbi:MAG: CHAT domain-containing protein [Bacteroidota bacterium]